MSATTAERTLTAMTWWFKRGDTDALVNLLDGLSEGERLEAKARMGDRAFLRGLYDASDGELRQRMSKLAASKSTAMVQAPADAGELVGYASTWLDRGGPDRQGHVIKPGAFSKWVEEVNSGAIVVPLVAGGDNGHSDSPFAVVGWVAEARQDDRGLWIRAALSSDPEAQAIRAKLASRALRGLSIQYLPGKVRPVRLADGRSAQELDEIEVFHVAVTGTSANASAQVLAAKGGTGGVGEYAKVVGNGAMAAELAEAQKDLKLLANLPSEVWRGMADALEAEESKALEADLLAWANSAEVAAAVRRDPGVETAQRDKRRWDQANSYSHDLAAWRDRQR
jgi:HK97 family phage prohead protease